MKHRVINYDYIPMLHTSMSYSCQLYTIQLKRGKQSLRKRVHIRNYSHLGSVRGHIKKTVFTSREVCSRQEKCIYITDSNTLPLFSYITCYVHVSAHVMDIQPECAWRPHLRHELPICLVASALFMVRSIPNTSFN